MPRSRARTGLASIVRPARYPTLPRMKIIDPSPSLGAPRGVTILIPPGTYRRCLFAPKLGRHVVAVAGPALRARIAARALLQWRADVAAHATSRLFDHNDCGPTSSGVARGWVN